MHFTLEHIGVAAEDTTALKDWYCRVLGAEVVWTNGETPPAFLLRVANGPWLEIYPSALAAAETSNNALRGWRHLALRVDSLDAAREELARRGVLFDQPVKPAGGGGRVQFFRDPEGNLLHLVERSTAGPITG